MPKAAAQVNRVRYSLIHYIHRKPEQSPLNRIAGCMMEALSDTAYRDMHIHIHMMMTAFCMQYLC